VDKKTIVEAAKRWSLPVWKNDCPSANNTKRTYYQDLITQIAPNSRLYKNIVQGIRRWQVDFW